MQSMRRLVDWRTTWSTVCSSAPHSQAAEEAIPHLYKQERKRPTPVRQRLSRTQALLGRVIPGEWAPVPGIKMRSLVGLPAHSALHWLSTQCAARMLLLSQKLASCCAAGVQMGVLIWGAVHVHSMDRWALSETGVLAPWNGVLEIAWLLSYATDCCTSVFYYLVKLTMKLFTKVWFGNVLFSGSMFKCTRYACYHKVKD